MNLDASVKFSFQQGEHHHDRSREPSYLSTVLKTLQYSVISTSFLQPVTLIVLHKCFLKFERAHTANHKQSEN